MATDINNIKGKKINELYEIIDVTEDTVLPAVTIDSGVISSEAGKLSVKKIKSYIQKGLTFEPNIVTDLESTNIQIGTLTENTIYQYGTLSSLTINNVANSYLESVIYFNSGSTPTVLTFNNEPIWINEAPTIEANKKYVISICNGFAIYGSN